MTKQQLIEIVSTNSGQPKTEVEAVVESVLGAITEALRNNERVDLRGFGSFVVKERKARQGRNPAREKPSPSPRSATRVSSPARNCLKRSVELRPKL